MADGLATRTATHTIAKIGVAAAVGADLLEVVGDTLRLLPMRTKVGWVRRMMTLAPYPMKVRRSSISVLPPTKSAVL